MKAVIHLPDEEEMKMGGYKPKTTWVPVFRNPTWYWRIWWWCGYNLGFYRLNWWYKERR